MRAVFVDESVGAGLSSLHNQHRHVMPAFITHKDKGYDQSFVVVAP